MEFCIVGKIAGAETIAEGSGIRELSLLRQRHGVGYWRKKKGIATQCSQPTRPLSYPVLVSV